MLRHPDLTEQQRDVLLYVAEHPRATFAEIRRACGCSNSPIRTLRKRGLLACNVRANGRMKAGSLRAGSPGILVIRYDQDARLTYATDNFYVIWGKWMLLGKTDAEIWNLAYRHAHFHAPDGEFVQPEDLPSRATAEGRCGLDLEIYMADHKFIPMDDGQRLTDEAGEFAGTENRYFVYQAS